MASDDTRSIGQQAEKLAAEMLLAAGLELVEKNYHCRYGEIDLIFRDQREVAKGAARKTRINAAVPLVFVEVRYRRSLQFGGALESISTAKQQKIHLAASHFMQKLPTQPAARFDVITISGDLSAQPYVDWLENVEMQHN